MSRPAMSSARARQAATPSNSSPWTPPTTDSVGPSAEPASSMSVKPSSPPGEIAIRAPDRMGHQGAVRMRPPALTSRGWIVDNLAGAARSRADRGGGWWRGAGDHPSGRGHPLLGPPGHHPARRPRPWPSRDRFPEPVRDHLFAEPRRRARRRRPGRGDLAGHVHRRPRARRAPAGAARRDGRWPGGAPSPADRRQVRASSRTARTGSATGYRRPSTRSKPAGRRSIRRSGSTARAAPSTLPRTSGR